MPFELGAKKAGLSLVHAFLHSVEGARPYISSLSSAFSEAVRRRNTIGYKFKSYRDGKVANVQGKILST